jgi:hypothetical protein
MHSRLHITALVVLMCACGPAIPDRLIGGDEATGETGDELDPPAAFTQGERLSPRLFASPEDTVDAVVLRGWRDTLLDLDCEFAPAIDGSMRCLPINSQIQRVYSTPTCEPDSALARIQDGDEFDCGQGYVTYGVDAGTCTFSLEYGVVRLGDEVPASDVNVGYYRPYSGDCIPIISSFPTDTYCTFSDEPLATFVGADVVLEDIGMIQRRTLVAEDGSIQLDGIFDPDLGVDLFGATDELVPSVSGTFAAYADASCSEPAACSSEPSCGFVKVDEGCEQRVMDIGAVIGEAFAGSDCAPVDDNQATCYAASERPEIGYVEQHVGAGRLARVWINHAATPIVPLDIFFYDTELESNCFVRDASGVCSLPESIYGFGSVFSDAECLVKIGAAYLSSCREPPKTVDGNVDEPMTVEPLPAFEGPTYTRNGQPDDGPAFNCTERPLATPLYAFEPSTIELAPVIEIPG